MILCLHILHPMDDKHLNELILQVYHIKSNNNCLQILAVQVEPSSSSGIDLPMDNDSPPR